MKKDELKAKSRTTIYLPKEMHQQVKRLGVETSQSSTSIIEKALTNYFKKKTVQRKLAI